MDYLNQILTNRSLPMANEGHYAVHDIAYHSLAILLPKKALDRLNGRIKLLIKFRTKVNNSKLSKLEKKVLEEVYEYNLKKMVEYIDYGTGNVAPVLVWEKTGQKHSGRSYEAYDLKKDVMNNLFENTANLFRGLKYRADNAMRKYIKDGEINIEYFEPTITLEQRNLAIYKSNEKIDKFIAEFNMENKNAIRSFEKTYSIEEFVNSVRERIRGLEENVK